MWNEAYKIELRNGEKISTTHGNKIYFTGQFIQTHNYCLTDRPSAYTALKRHNFLIIFVPVPGSKDQEVIILH